MKEPTASLVTRTMGGASTGGSVGRALGSGGPQVERGGGKTSRTSATTKLKTETGVNAGVVEEFCGKPGRWGDIIHLRGGSGPMGSDGFSVGWKLRSGEKDFSRW